MAHEERRGPASRLATTETSTLPIEGMPETDDNLENGAEPDVGRRFFRPQTVVSFLIAFAILIFFVTRVDIDFGAVLARVRTAQPLLLLLALGVYYLSFPVRAMRWRLLLDNAGLRRQSKVALPGVRTLSEFILLSWFVNCIVPAKLGDAYRGYLLKRTARVSFSATIGTVLTERIVDVLVLFSLMAAAGLIAFHGQLPPQLLYLLGAGSALVGLVAVGLLALRGLRPLAKRLLSERLHGLYQKFEQGVLRSFTLRTVPMLLMYTGLVWLLEGLRLYSVASALGLNLPLSVTLFIALASSLLTTIPFTPAGLGVVESAVITALLWFGVDSATAVSVSILDRAISYWSIILVGFVLYLLRANRNRWRSPGRAPSGAR